MRISEVSRVTGLTKRSIRYYLEHGLIEPRVYEKNGRQYRDYDEADIALLEAIASLRRAGFSVEQIRLAREHPEAIPELWREYIRVLKQTRLRIDRLLEAAKNAEPEQLGDMFAMSSALEEAVRGLPMPSPERGPRFLYLDDIPVSAESRERDRQQYARTRYISPPNLHLSRLGSLRGGYIDPGFFALGERAFEFFPVRKKRTQWILIALVLALLTGLIVVGLMK